MLKLILIIISICLNFTLFARSTYYSDLSCDLTYSPEEGSEKKYFPKPRKPANEWVKLEDQYAPPPVRFKIHFRSDMDFCKMYVDTHYFEKRNISLNKVASDYSFIHVDQIPKHPIKSLRMNCDINYDSENKNYFVNLYDQNEFKFMLKEVMFPNMIDSHYFSRIQNFFDNIYYQASHPTELFEFEAGKFEHRKYPVIRFDLFDQSRHNNFVTTLQYEVSHSDNIQRQLEGKNPIYKAYHVNCRTTPLTTDYKWFY